MSRWVFKQIEPQPARGKFTEDMWESDAWVAEEKYDGDRRIAQFCRTAIRFTGRRKSVEDGLYVEKTDNVPHLSKLDWGAAELEGTVLDGEMIVDPNVPGDGGMSKYVTSIMGSLPAEAIRKQTERGWLRYAVFDCLYCGGKDVRGEDLLRRRSYAEQAVKAWGNQYAFMAPAYHDKRAALKHVMAAGGEGVILKHVAHRYGEKNRWVKVKREATADVVIMGYKAAKEVSTKKSGEESMTKYAKAGVIGALVVGQHKLTPRSYVALWELTEVATVSGMTDDERRDFTLRGKEYIGMVVEIKHNGREPTGRFRHPRFVQFRHDKTAESCIYYPEES
jgi:ATP-dependent DNA ligase